MTTNRTPPLPTAWAPAIALVTAEAYPQQLDMDALLGAADPAEVLRAVTWIAGNLLRRHGDLECDPLEWLQVLGHLAAADAIAGTVRAPTRPWLAGAT